MPISSKVIVKVGKRSNLNFRSTIAYRAITMDELESLANNHSEISIIIIENILQSEDKRIKQFIDQFEKRSSNNKVFFYVEDNDSITCGVADELAYDIYLNIKDLYKAIKINCGISVDPDLSLSSQFIEGNADDNIFDESFQDALETINKSNVAESLPEIDNKDDIDEFDTSILYEYSKETDEDNGEHKKVSDGELNNQNDPEDAPNTDLNSGEIEEKYKQQINELKQKVSDNIKEIQQLKKQLQDSFDKNKSAMLLTKAVEDERDAFRDQLSKFNTKEVMEQPITLQEYSELQNKLKELEASKDDINASNLAIQDLKEKLKELGEDKQNIEQQLAEYKDRLRESGSKLSVANKRNDEQEEKINALLIQVSSLEQKVEDGDNKSIELQSMTSDIALKEATIASLNSQISESNTAIENLKVEIKNISKYRDSLLSRVEAEVSARLFITDALSKSVRLMQDLDKELSSEYDKEDVLNQQLQSLSEENKANSDTIVQYQSQIADLERQVNDVDKRVELARNYSKQELESSKREAIEWKTKFDVIQSQFTSKEAQYNSLIQTIGMNENGVQSLLENNKTMDEINRTLRDQIVLLKNDLEKYKKDALLAKQTTAALEESNKNLRISMKAMTIGISGGVGTSSGITPFNYQGKAMIIPVFGCGSFGITTTAMSLATKLSAQARVLYIDFDMVAPKADGWFKVNPMIRNVPDIDINSAKATALSIFVDKQIQYFLSYSSSLILKPVQTKSGCIDYIGGFYAKPDTIKLMSADFTSFLNYCGNNYTYVIIDLGRLGSSDVNDQIIKAFSDVAYRSVVVTTFDKFEIRTFRMKLAEARIDVTNVAWLVNMCERTNLDDTARRSISPAQYSLMPFNSDIYGKKVDFTKDRLTRDKLALFMDSILFKK